MRYLAFDQLGSVFICVHPWLVWFVSDIDLLKDKEKHERDDHHHDRDVSNKVSRRI